MNKELAIIIDFVNGQIIGSSKVIINSADGNIGESGHHTFKIGYQQGKIKHFVFAKVYNIAEKLFDDIQTIKAEVYALSRTYAVGIPSPELIGADIQGERIGKPIIVTSGADGAPLDGYFEKVSVSQRERIADESFSSMLDLITRLGNIKSSNNSFGPLFAPSWIKDVNSFQQFLTKGLYREFWRRGMLDETYTFHSNWAEKTFNWASGLIEDSQLRDFQLYHGNLDGTNLLFDYDKKGTLKLAGVVDWEYAYWGPPEKDLGDFLASITSYINYKQVQKACYQYWQKKG